MPRVVRVSSTRVAEASKLTENVFRAVNIALVNELKLIYERMGIDVWEVLDAAATKPFGYMRFDPGPGWGGHCIPLDPYYLSWKARAHGRTSHFIELAGEINTDMPDHVVGRVIEALNARGRPASGSRVLILGLAYKPDVSDDRESPSYRLMDRLAERGAEVAYHDPHVPVIQPGREHSAWTGTRSVGWDRETISSFDVVVIATRHDAVNYGELAEWASVHGNLYGTPAAPLEAALRDGRDVLLDIDTQGAAQLRRRYPEAVLVFIVAPSMAELEQRLRERRSDADQDIARRLARARDEIALWKDYDYLIVNRDVKEAMDQLMAVIQAERCRTTRLGVTFPDLEVPN